VDRGSHTHTLNLRRGDSIESESPRRPDNFSKKEASKVNHCCRLDSSKDAALTNLRWIPQGRQPIIATVDTSGTLGFWEVPKAREQRESRVLAEISGHEELEALAFEEEKQRIFVAGHERCIKVYDVLQCLDTKFPEPTLVLGSGVSATANLAGHSLKIISLAVNPAMPDVFASGAIDRTVLLWDYRDPKHPVGCLQGTEMAGDSMDMSRDGRTILVASHRSARPLQIFDLRVLRDEGTGATGRTSSQIMVPPHRSYEWSGRASGTDETSEALGCLPFSVAWDSFENRIIVACGEKDGLGRVYQRPEKGGLDSLRILTTVSGKGRALYTSAVSADGRNVAFGGVDGSVRICDLRTIKD
jgi:WD40 repeat protein